MNRDFIAKHWYAYAYEQFETQTHDIEFLLKVLSEEAGDSSLSILEVACGGGRISIPLAKAGHSVTGFDADESMLLRCYRRMQNMSSMTCYQADALDAPWGKGFDLVILAGNILINIETDQDYMEAQKIFINKAFAALRPGGHLYMDYDQHSYSSAIKFFNHLGESGRLGKDAIYNDELGTSGVIKIYGNVYDPVTRICTWASHWDLQTNNGERIIKSTMGHKHIPTLEQVYSWLSNAGFEIEKSWRNYSEEPLSENEQDFVRATIWARKG